MRRANAAEVNDVDARSGGVLRYTPAARWRWSDEVGPSMDGANPRSYCCQYRESDLAFVERLLAEEGLAWRLEQAEDGPRMVLFADSRDRSAVTDDPSIDAGGARFHGAHAREKSDSVQALAALRSVGAAAVTLLSYDYKSKQAVAANSPSRLSNGSLPWLESFDTPGQYAYADGADARRYADLQMEAREARSQLWRGRSTLRTLISQTSQMLSIRNYFLARMSKYKITFALSQL